MSKMMCGLFSIETSQSGGCVTLRGPGSNCMELFVSELGDLSMLLDSYKQDSYMKSKDIIKRAAEEHKDALERLADG